MSKLRIEFQKGGYYHITNRTASGLLLFNDEQDYLALNERIERYAKECNIEIITKSLMPTHYHLLIRQDGDVTASKFIQKFSISYVRYFSKRYNHHGAVFGQRFSTTLVADIYQMRNTCCYIHANGYKAELVDNPLDWQYGNLSEFYSFKFWDDQIDAYLLKSFGSREGFVEAFEIYIATLKLFRPQKIHRKTKFEVDMLSKIYNIKHQEKRQKRKQKSEHKIKSYSLSVEDIE